MTTERDQGAPACSPARVVILNDFSVARGGATGLALLSAQLLRGAGIPVTYIAGDSASKEFFDRHGIDYFSLNETPTSPSSINAAAVKAIWNGDVAGRIAQWIQENDQPGFVYHLHGFHKILSPSVLSALLPVQARTVLHAHDFFLACPNGAFMHYGRGEVCHRTPLSPACLATNCDRRRAYFKIYRVGRQLLINHARQGKGHPYDILMIHESMRAYFERSGVEPGLLTTVLNPCVPFSEQPVNAAANKEFFFVGRLMEEKGPHDLLAAARKAGVPVRLIGDGPLQAQLEAQYPEAKFEGWRSKEELAELIRHARCLVMPSRYPEPFGLVAVEALRSGVPVIASAHSFLAHDIVQHGMGFAADTQSHDAFAEVLHKVAQDDALVERMSKAGVSRGNVLANTPEDWRDALIRIYRQKLMGQRASVKTS